MMNKTRTNNNTLLEKIQNRFKGYYKEYLNLNQFIKHNNLDMILNNDIIDPEVFYLYNYEQLYEIESDEVYSNFKYYFDSIFNDIEDIEDIEDYYTYLYELVGKYWRSY